MLAKEGGLQMGVTIAVMPRQLVTIGSARRQQLIEHLRQITFKTRLKLDGTNCTGAADVEHMYNTCLDAGRLYNAGHVPIDALHVSVTTRM